MFKFKSTILAVATAAMLVSSSAHAGGFLADTFIRPFSPEAADAADQWNHNAGNPVDHAATALMDQYVPGSGTAVETYWQAQRFAERNQIQNPHRPSSPAMTAMGNYCSTQVGIVGPGPMNPVGSVCFTNGPFGTIYGQVVQ